MAEPTWQHRPRATSAVERLAEANFPVVLRGYDRGAVDGFLEELSKLVAELETTQLRENVVQRALDEVGEQTAGILQRAHEAAEELAARSRAQAQGRIQRAEREAEIVRSEAETYSSRLVEDARVLWEERQRLIDEMRQLADEVLATADDASERVQQPELLRQAAEEPVAEPPVAEEPIAEESAFEAAPEDEEAQTETDLILPTSPEGEEPRAT